MPMPNWREINGILFVSGFNWLENGKESQWVKLKDDRQVATE